MEESNGRMRIAFDFVLELIRLSPRRIGYNVSFLNVIESLFSYFPFLQFLLTFLSFVFRSLSFVCVCESWQFVSLHETGKEGRFEERVENNRPALAAEVSARVEFGEGGSEPSFILVLYSYTWDNTTRIRARSFFHEPRRNAALETSDNRPLSVSS